MADNKDRIERIIKRAIDYNNGWITPDAFATLEGMDGEHEEVQHISFIKRDKIIKAISEILDQDDTDFFKPEPDPEPTEPAFSMTLDEYNALPLHEQFEVYNKHPNEVERLVHPVVTVQITKEIYNDMSLLEQSHYYNEAPDQVKALLDGSIPYIEKEVVK